MKIYNLLIGGTHVCVRMMIGEGGLASILIYKLIVHTLHVMSIHSLQYCCLTKPPCTLLRGIPTFQSARGNTHILAMLISAQLNTQPSSIPTSSSPAQYLHSSPAQYLHSSPAQYPYFSPAQSSPAQYPPTFQPSSIPTFQPSSILKLNT